MVHFNYFKLFLTQKCKDIKISSTCIDRIVYIQLGNPPQANLCVENVAGALSFLI